MQIAITISLCVIPLALLGLIAFFVVSDIKEARRKRYFRVLVENCEEVHGTTFAAKLLRLCTNGTMGLESMITVFENHCNIR